MGCNQVCPYNTLAGCKVKERNGICPLSNSVTTKPMTNGDRIRSMSDEELADFIDRCEMSDIDYSKTFCNLCNGQYECSQCRLEWLQQPAEEVHHE